MRAIQHTGRVFLVCAIVQAHLLFCACADLVQLLANVVTMCVVVFFPFGCLHLSLDLSMQCFSYLSPVDSEMEENIILIGMLNDVYVCMRVYIERSLFS